MRVLKKLIRGLKQAQAIPGQEPAALAARAQELDGYEHVTLRSASVSIASMASGDAPHAANGPA